MLLRAAPSRFHRTHTTSNLQAAVIPEALKGRDVIGVAKTGSGKTAAFLLPILHGLARNRYGVYALVLTPTRCAPVSARLVRRHVLPLRCLCPLALTHRAHHGLGELHAVQYKLLPLVQASGATHYRQSTHRELAYQIAEQVDGLGRGSGVTSLTIVGGMEQHSQALALRKRPHIVVATPGRLADMLATAEDLRAGVKRCAVLVLDEADRLLESSFEAPLRRILAVSLPFPMKCELVFCDLIVSLQASSRRASLSVCALSSWLELKRLLWSSVLPSFPPAPRLVSGALVVLPCCCLRWC